MRTDDRDRRRREREAERQLRKLGPRPSLVDADEERRLYELNRAGVDAPIRYRPGDLVIYPDRDPIREPGFGA